MRRRGWILVSIVITQVLVGPWGMARAANVVPGPAAVDPCASPAFPLDLVFSSNTPGREYRVAGGGTVFYLTLFPPASQGDTEAAYADDMPGWFGLMWGTRVYNGFVHSFHHRSYRHLCVDGPVVVSTFSGRRLRDDGYAQGRLEGRLTGTWITVSLVVQGYRYWVYGPLVPIPRHG